MQIAKFNNFKYSNFILNFSAEIFVKSKFAFCHLASTKLRDLNTKFELKLIDENLKMGH